MPLNHNTHEFSDSSKIKFENFFRKHDAIFLLMSGDTGQLIDANESALHFYGYSLQEIRSMKIGDINKLPPDELDAERQRAVREERKYFVVPHLLANGEIRTVEVHTTPIMLEHKTCLFSVIHDISKRKKTEQELERIFNLSADMICIADIKSVRFKKVNPAFNKILGYDEKELLSKSFLSFVHPDDRGKTTAKIKQELTAGTETANFVNRYRHKDGTYKLLEWNTRPVPKEGITYAVARDITGEVRIRERIQEAKTKALQTVSQGIAHEFRNLLTGIGSCVYSVRHHIEDEKSKELLDSVMVEIRRGQSIIKDLLLYSQNESIELGIVELGGFLRSYLRNWAGKELYKHGISMERDICRRHILIEANTKHLELVMSNIIHNSIEAMTGSDDRVINLKLSTEDGMAVIRVEDSGKGMNENQLKVAMEPFYTTKTYHQGHGLGLSISSNLVNSMNGTMDIVSSPGKGITVLICFPLLKPNS